MITAKFVLRRMSVREDIEPSRSGGGMQKVTRASFYFDNKGFFASTVYGSHEDLAVRIHQQLVTYLKTEEEKK